jgi:hypothetical protein
MTEKWIFNYATWEPLRKATQAEISIFGDDIFDFTFEGMLVRAQIG